jgi:2-dehydropantoate 2-reductase
LAARPGRGFISGPRLTRIAILGAGAIGCFVGGCWQAAGLPVHFVGRPMIRSAIRDHGLTLTDYEGWEARLAPDEVAYSCDPDGIADADIIALAVKSGATAVAAEEIRQYGRPGSLVLSLQNGVTNIDVLRAELGDRFEIAQGMVPYNVAYMGDGRFHKGVKGQVWAEDRPQTRELSKRVGGSPAGLVLSSDMSAVIWGKLLINLNNAVNALSGRTLTEQLRDRDYRRVLAASMREGLNLLAHAGVRPAKVGPVPPRLLPAVVGSPDWLFNSLFLKLQKIDAKARSSMGDDIATGRRTEIDYLNGELVRLAERLGTEAPVNRKLVELIRKAEGGARAIPPAELRREVLGR